MIADAIGGTFFLPGIAADADVLSPPRPELLKEADEMYRSSLSSAMADESEGGHGATILSLQRLQDQDGVPLAAQIKLPPTPDMLAGAPEPCLPALFLRVFVRIRCFCLSAQVPRPRHCAQSPTALP